MKNNKRKAFSQAIWLIICIIIALATAVIIISLLSRTSGDVSESAGDATETAGITLKEQLCAESCKSCVRVYGSECQGHWTSISAETGCADVLPVCN